MTALKTQGDGGFRLASPDVLSREELAAAWKAAYGQPPPKGIGSRLLTLSGAYHRQAKAQGGLRPETRARLLAIAGGERPLETATRSTAAAGTRLARDWHGETHVVDVMDKGVLYRGETFRSLSQVAQRITGAKWSGPRFFGIVPR